ncbi:hypothetical protein NL676_008762 [Syzygium grande]|nr:hypothetical protein NL676_008762 [Syzygium grande]
MDLDPRNHPLLAFAFFQIDPNYRPYLPTDDTCNLFDQMPHLTNPKVASFLAQFVPANILQTWTLLHARKCNERTLANWWLLRIRVYTQGIWKNA